MPPVSRARQLVWMPARWNSGTDSRLTVPGWPGGSSLGSRPVSTSRFCRLAMTERWDMTTPLAVPVVPEENMIRAGSSSVTRAGCEAGGCGAGGCGAVGSPASTSGRSASRFSTRPGGTGPSAPATGGRLASTRTGAAWARAAAVSASFHQALPSTATAPRVCVAQNAATHSIWLKPSSMIRWPGRTPSPYRCAATRATAPVKAP